MFSSLALLATSPFMMNAPEVKQVNAATVKDLSEIISFSQANFLQSYIGDYFVDFNLSERIFPTNNYINDHQNSFLDESGNPINIADGILINGQTLTYWINYSNSRLTYPRNEGVHVFPISAGGVYNPVSVEITGTAIAFKFNLEFFPMDSIVITFKAGVFKAYYNGTTFNLSEDLTFRSTLNPEKTTDFNKKVILTADDRGEKTSPNGGKYHQYLLWTNIPRNSEYVSQPFATDNDRYIHDNILINGATITSYNTWARGNSKDFTNLNDPSTQNSDYETGHPTGSANVTYDLAVYTQMAIDQPNYVFEIKVPNQLVTDLSLGTVAFSFREGSAWYTLDKDNNFIVGRHNPTSITAYGNEKKDTLDNLVDVSLYRESEQITIAETIADAETAFSNAFTKADIDASFENAKNTILALKTDEEKTKEETIDVVVNLIDEIPDQITYTKECYNKIKAALEAYIALTNEEQAQVPAAKVDEMYNAYSEYQALDLANYKDLTITTINEVVNVDMHHDMFNNGDEVDCGNWATHILQDIENCKVTWIANPVSIEAYGTKPALEGNTYYDLSVLKDKQFDLIFICRSDSWLPPHLDKEFEKLYYFVLEEFGGAMVDSQITECREWEEAAEQMSKIYQQCYEHNRKARGAE